MPHRLGLCTIFLPTTFLHISCKLLPYQICVLQIVPYLILANYHLVNSTINFCKLFFLYLANCHLSNNYFWILQTVILQTAIFESCTLSYIFSTRLWSMVSLLGGCGGLEEGHLASSSPQQALYWWCKLETYWFPLFACFLRFSF